MSNHTTKQQREQWITRADALIIMDAKTCVINYHDVLNQLTDEFNISLQSARTAAAHAAMRRRGRGRINAGEATW